MMNTTEQVAVVGLGAMGSALARQLVRAGFNVAVWNRTASKADALVSMGATLAPSVAHAVSSSSVVVVCVDEIRITRQIFGTADTQTALSGRLLLQLSTGTPEDARVCSAWAQAHGAGYLSGAIHGTPDQLGQPGQPIFVSGPESAHRRAESVVAALCGAPTYLGEQIGAASALDIALLAYLFGGFIGFAHGARVCEAEGLRVQTLGNAIAALASTFGEILRAESLIIQAKDYNEPEASVRTCAGAMELLARQAREAAINSEFPDYALRVFTRAVEAGYGDEAMGAIVKLL